MILIMIVCSRYDGYYVTDINMVTGVCVIVTIVWKDARFNVPGSGKKKKRASKVIEYFLMRQNIPDWTKD